MNAIKRILPTLKPHWKEILLSTITMILVVVADLLIPQQIQRVIDEGIAVGDTDRVINDGEVIERGTHQSLLYDQGFYHGLYISQFKGTAVVV